MKRVVPLRAALLIVSGLLIWAPRPAAADEPAKPVPGTPFCGLPLCKDADGLRRQGDLQGALKLYRYIQEEVDAAENVLRKPLLWFPIASLHGELQQPQEGLDALQKYQQYIASRPDGELPPGQRREDVERLSQSLTAARLRVAGGSEAEPPPAALHPEIRVDKAVLAKLPPKLAAEIERHIEAGLQLNKQGLHRSARVELDEAYELSRRPELLYSMAQLLLRQGQPREAAVYLQRYLDSGAQGSARTEAEATLARVRRELELENEATRTAEAQRVVHASESRGLKRAGVALLTIGGGLLLTGFGLGIGAVVTARNVESAERFDPTQEALGHRLQNVGIAFDVVGLVSMGIGAVCLGVARRREAALPVNLRGASASASSLPALATQF